MLISGGENLATILTFGQRIVVSKLDVTKKGINIKEHFILADELELPKNYLGNQDTISDYLTVITKKFSLDKQVYICLAYGSGVQYRTSRVGIDTINEITDNKKMKPADKEAHILEICRSNLPEGLEKLHSEWRSCIIDCHECDRDYVISGSYIPEEYYKNIMAACKSFGLTVLCMSSLAGGLYSLVDPEDKQLIIRIMTGYLAINMFGMVCWPYPAGNQATREDILVNLSNISERLFPIDSSKMNVFIENGQIGNYSKIPIMSDFPPDTELLAACGIALANNQSAYKAPQITKERKKYNVTDKLRKLFK